MALSINWHGHSFNIHFGVFRRHFLSVVKFEEQNHLQQLVIGLPVKRWLLQTNLIDSHTNVIHYKFRPKALDLVLTISSVNVCIEIYD